MTVNQTTERRLTPSDVREAAAFVQGVRRRQDPFDIAVNVSIGEDPDPMTTARSFGSAGATWCIELPPGRSEPASEYRRTIRRGPPAA